MSCPTSYEVIEIQRNECIGNSLATINDNFLALKTGACDNTTYVTNLQQDIANLSFLITSLSSITVPGAAKAWASFDATRDPDTPSITSIFNTNRVIYSSYNIDTVYKKADGDFRVTFKNRFPNTNYAVIGTCQQTATLSGDFVWFQPYTFTTTYTEIKTFSNKNTGANPQRVSLVVF